MILCYQVMVRITSMCCLHIFFYCSSSLYINVLVSLRNDVFARTKINYKCFPRRTCNIQCVVLAGMHAKPDLQCLHYTHGWRKQITSIHHRSFPHTTNVPHTRQNTTAQLTLEREHAIEEERARADQLEEQRSVAQLQNELLTEMVAAEQVEQ